MNDVQTISFFPLAEPPWPGKYGVGLRKRNTPQHTQKTSSTNPQTANKKHYTIHMDYVPRADRQARLRRAETLLACGWSIPDIAASVNLPVKSLRNHFSKRTTRERVLALADRSLATLSKQATASIAVARDRLIEALPLVANRIAEAALAPFFVTREITDEDGNTRIVQIPNPDYPPSFIETAVRLVLDRGGLTQRFAEAITGSEHHEAPPAPTPEHIDALARLVQAARSLPTPSPNPPKVLPEST